VLLATAAQTMVTAAVNCQYADGHFRWEGRTITVFPEWLETIDLP
jgi:hypothetical protein